MEETPLGQWSQYLIDDGKKLDFQDILSPDILKRFRPAVDRTSYIEGRTNAVWIRFTMVNKGSEDINTVVLYPAPYLDHFDIYISTDDGPYLHTTINEADAISSRAIKYRRIAYPLVIPAGSTTNIFVRVTHDLPGKLETSLIMIGSASFVDMQNTENIFLGIFYGIMIAMFFYNLFLFSVTRRVSYLFYCIHIILVTLVWATINGQAKLYIFTWETPRINFYNSMVIGWSMFASVVFTRSFLKTWRRAPRLDKLLLFLMGLVIFQAICVLLDWGTLVIFIAEFIGASVMALIVTGFVVWKDGYTPARYYTLAWITFSAGVALYTLSFMGFTDSGFISNWGGHVGSALEVVLLSFALADRINSLQHEKENAEILYRTALEQSREELELKVIKRTTELVRAKEIAEKLAWIDELTQLNNRRAFYELCEKEIKRAARYAHPLVMIMVDIDYFKKINDSFGHATGDIALKAMADVIKSVARATDVAGRIGGEEFGICLSQTDISVGVKVAERLRKSVSEIAVKTNDDIITYTCSIGVVELDNETQSLDSLMAQADAALYQAKHQGRNKVVISEA